MNSLSGAEAVVRMLDLYGVRHIFGLCGDTSLPFYDALYRMEHGITHVLTRDERSAAYMADGYARVSGRPGVCEGPSGGGATYLLPGLVEANESCSPVLGITSDVPVTSRGRYPLTELDQESLFRPLTKWNTVCDRADQVPQAIRSAFRQMTTGRPGAAHIGLPYDVMKEPVDPAEIWCQAEHDRYPAWRSAADPAAVEAAAAALAAGQPRRVHLRRRRADGRRDRCPRRGRRRCSTRRSARPSAARAASPTPIRSASASSGRTAASSRRARSCSRRTWWSSSAAAPDRPPPSAGRSRRATFRSSTSTSTRRSSRPTTGRRTRSSAMRGSRSTALRDRLTAGPAGRAPRTGAGAEIVSRARQAKFDAFRALAGSRRAADSPRAHPRRAEPGPAARRDRRRRPWHAVSVRVGLLRAAGRRPPLPDQPRARRARLLDGRRAGRVVRRLEPQVRLDHGRRQLRLRRRRARDRRALQGAAADARAVERDLRLDQGQPEGQLRGALLRRRLRGAPTTPGSPAATASSRGGSRIPRRWARCCARPPSTTGRRWSTSSPSRSKTPPRRCCSGWVDQQISRIW